MGQMQRRKRLWRELSCKSRFKVIFHGASMVNLQDLDRMAATTPPLTMKEFVECVADQGVAFWYDAQDGCIKAQAFADDA